MGAYDSFSDTKILGGFVANGAGGILTATTDGPAMDTAGFTGVLFVYQLVRSAGTYSLFLQHGDDGASFVDVPVEDLIGADPAAATVAGRLVNAAVVTKTGRVGTLSKKRFFRYRLVNDGAMSVLVGGGGLGFIPITQPVAAQNTGT